MRSSTPMTPSALPKWSRSGCTQEMCRMCVLLTCRVCAGCVQDVCRLRAFPSRARGPCISNKLYLNDTLQVVYGHAIIWGYALCITLPNLTLTKAPTCTNKMGVCNLVKWLMESGAVGPLNTLCGSCSAQTKVQAQTLRKSHPTCITSPPVMP